MGLECTLPLAPDLDLHPAKRHRLLAAAHHDARVIERDLRGLDATHAQDERPSAGAHLEHLDEPTCAGDGTHSTADRSFGPECGDAARRQDLGHLEPLAQAAVLRRPRVLQRHLLLTAALARPQHEPGARQVPVARVVR